MIDRVELVGPTWHRFLSPHYDDIALSCGGTAALLTRDHRAPEVIVVFGAEPKGRTTLSDYAAGMHRTWGLDSAEVHVRRQEEERAASIVMGTTFRVLPFHDAIYRGEAYLSDDDLFGAVAPTDGWLPAAMIEAAGLAGPPDPKVRLYAPLGVGRHVDHQLVCLAAVRLARDGWDVWFYEDLPYALREGALPDRLATIEIALALVATVDVTSTWNVKMDAIMAYPSQLAAIFSSVGSTGRRHEIDALMRGYAAGPEPGVRRERFWCLTDTR
jgi:LmbE family N-acetylglucosaminyl deacetylase